MIDLLAWMVGLPPLILSLVLTIELVAGQWPVRRRVDAAAAMPRSVVLIPAHDEAGVIAATIAALRAVAPPETRLLLVADNCRDDTANIARGLGVETIERIDPDHFGKGFALAFAREHLRQDPPEIVLLVDADCEVVGDGLRQLAAAAQATGRPVQSSYLLRPRPDLGARVAVSGFAFLVRNLIRQRGLAQIGAPALLTGSGIAFPWAAFDAAPLGTDDIVEDLVIGIALARAGHGAIFAPATTIWSDPARPRALWAQRTRWEQGFLRSGTALAPSLLSAGGWPLFWMGLHLLVPPLALLGTVDALALLMLGIIASMGGSAVPLALLAAAVLLLLFLLWLSWVRFGRAQITAGQLLVLPIYMIWKLPIYVAALLRPERRWKRTDRDGLV